VWRAQFPHEKDEHIVEDLFDIQVMIVIVVV
jgi:hypothetical protein